MTILLFGRYYCFAVYLRSQVLRTTIIYSHIYVIDKFRYRFNHVNVYYSIYSQRLEPVYIDIALVLSNRVILVNSRNVILSSSCLSLSKYLFLSTMKLCCSPHQITSATLLLWSLVVQLVSCL